MPRYRVLRLDPAGRFIGPPRIWDQTGEGPGLMMSRSFGDKTGHKVGMTCVPEVQTLRKGPGDVVLILGSDGVWEKTAEHSFTSACQKYYDSANTAEKICKELVSTAARNWDSVGLA